MNMIYIDFSRIISENLLSLIGIAAVLFLGLLFAIVWLVRKK